MISISKNANTNYLAKIVQLKTINKHPNADKLQIAVVDFQNVIVGLDAKVGDFTLDVVHNRNFYNRLKDIRNGHFSIGEVIEEAEERVEDCKILRDKCKHKPDLEKVNDFLLKVRKEFWNG